ncbi:hypothetical protein FRC16_006250, partial [Serendipita sp. 398]
MSYGYAYDGRGLTYRPNPHHSFNKSAAFGFSRSRKYGRNAHHYNHPPATVEQAAEPVRPPNAHPEKLIELLKSSGEYDRLRKQIFARFQNSDMRKVLLSRVDGVVTECLEGDPKVLSKPPESLHGELMQELDTYPFVERQVLCVPIWREDDWIAHIERGITNLIHDRPVDAPPTPPPQPASALASTPAAPVEVANNNTKKAEPPK